jgi:hypothetical protein
LEVTHSYVRSKDNEALFDCARDIWNRQKIVK